jgi:hypothetical protein
MNEKKNYGVYTSVVLAKVISIGGRYALRVVL